ncbi:hypothetical protein BN946_scf184843.g3 [Trametes cinnabarina]|uniref:Cyclin N-terminal domain-containing protein n=1 Tax=Pycnoporus cinnabarinus TaxID=5643 RepID=A0A060SDJ5_PYCCI|nr:hypothetical protein BN946_scf184843.g3 [Trametes cinnabarina]
MASSPVHPASLVDPALHSPALLELIDISLDRNLIEHIVDTVTETVDYALGRPSSSTRGRSMSRHTEHSKFLKFVTDVIDKAEVKVPALLVTLVYINRAKPHIQIALEQWANERVFLGALILANKLISRLSQYLNDSTLKNVHWALCTGVFGKRDIGWIEREFLDVLDFELGVSEADLLAHHDALLAISHAPRLSARPSHQHHARRTSSPLGSRWSTDSSDMDVDSESSSESLSLPRTPEPHVPVSSVPFPASSKAAENVDFAPATQVRLSTSDDASSASLPQQPHHSPAHHRARASALSILRSFPIPHFHSHCSSHKAHASAASHRVSAIPQPYHHQLAPAAQAMTVRA